MTRETPTTRPSTNPRWRCRSRRTNIERRRRVSYLVDYLLPPTNVCRRVRSEEEQEEEDKKDKEEDKEEEREDKEENKEEEREDEEEDREEEKIEKRIEKMRKRT